MKFYEPQVFSASANASFRRWQEIIRNHLPSANIEHIGSTAINGALSKGDLDIFIGVAAAQHSEAVAALKCLGFYEKEDTLRDDALCMLILDQEPGLALQVVAAGSRYEFFLHFRDALNGDAELVRQYNELKIACSGMSVQVYRDRKSQFIEDALIHAIKPAES